MATRRPTPQAAARRSRSRAAVAAGTWGPPRGGATHGSIDLDVTDAERWCRAGTGVSLAHVVGAAVARALAAAPEANARVVLGAVRRRPAVDVSYVVDIGRGRDMTAACVRDADRKSPRQTAREVFAAARAARRGADEAFGRSRAVAGRVPSMFVRPGMALAGFVAGGLGRRVPGLRLPAHPFGSALISSVEAWGVPRALPPLAPFVHLGLVVAVGAVACRPWVHDGVVVPRRVVSIGVTFDHRLIDGALAGTMMRVVAAAVERPWEAWPDGGARPPAAT